MRNPDDLFRIADGWYRPDIGNQPINFVAIMDHSCVAWATDKESVLNIFSIRDLNLARKGSGSAKTLNHPCIDGLDEITISKARPVRGWSAGQFNFFGKLTWLAPLTNRVETEWDDYFEWSK